MRRMNLSVKSSGDGLRGQRLPRHGVDHGQHILHAMIELFDQRALVRLGFRHRLLMFLAAAERLFGRQLLRAHAEILLLQPVAQFGLALHFRLLEIKIDEDRHFRAQDERIDRLEHHIHGAGRIGLEKMGVVAEEARSGTRSEYGGCAFSHERRRPFRNRPCPACSRRAR